MGLYLLVGPPGVGKTTVLEALSERGYATLDADSDPSLCGWIDTATGRKVADWSPEQATAPSGCAWGWDENRMHEIVADPPGDPFFFAGNAIGVAKYYPLFTKVFALFADDEILVKRVSSPRNNPNNYGQKPKHIAQTLAINKGFKEREQARGVILIDAMQPLDTVIAEILNCVNEGA